MLANTSCSLSVLALPISVTNLAAFAIGLVTLRWAWRWRCMMLHCNLLLCAAVLHHRCWAELLLHAMWVGGILQPTTRQAPTTPPALLCPVQHGGPAGII